MNAPSLALWDRFDRPLGSSPPNGFDLVDPTVKGGGCFANTPGERDASAAESPTPSSKVAFLMVYFVGSRHEGLGERGMAICWNTCFQKSGSSPIRHGSSRSVAHLECPPWTDRNHLFREMVSTSENIDFARGSKPTACERPH